MLPTGAVCLFKVLATQTQRSEQHKSEQDAVCRIARYINFASSFYYFVHLGAIGANSHVSIILSGCHSLLLLAPYVFWGTLVFIALSSSGNKTVVIQYGFRKSVKYAQDDIFTPPFHLVLIYTLIPMILKIEVKANN